MTEEGMEDRVEKMFVGRTLFITGGTGFLGKVLVEKLLRCMPSIKKIYLMIRTKKGKDPNERLKDMFSNPLFGGVIEQRGLETLLNVCGVISGDCILPDLGISDADLKILQNDVSLVYHCAATIRFDESLKKAVLLNARGTKLMLKLAKTLPKLELFCHISTSYCHLKEKLLLEQPYPPPADPHKIIKVIEWLDEAVVDSMTKKILDTAPNTYAYTKALSEALVVEQMNELPILILRPSIVVPIRYEPIRGWTDNINGPTGLLIGAGKGVLRTMYCSPSGYGDYLPVDFAVNGILVGSWNMVVNKDKERSICNMTSSADIKVSWAEIIDIGRWLVTNKIPLNGVAWYPGGSIKSNRLHHQIDTILYHWIPAIIVDCLLYCLGYPPVLCRVQRRIQKGFDVFEFYANNTWDFDNKNTLYMRQVLNKIESKKYAIDDPDIDVYQYFEDCIRAARIYILKETDDTIPAAKRHMQIMYWIDKICKFLIVGLFLYFIGSMLLRIFFPESPTTVLENIS